MLFVSILESSSTKVRMLVSIIANYFRVFLGFFSMLIIVRALNPDEYGDFRFLMALSLSLISLFDCGASNAFFTFISKEKPDRGNYSFFLLILGLQFIIIVLAIFLLPYFIMQKIWMTHSRALILLSFCAVFFQQRLWDVVSYIGESERKTGRVQFATVVLTLCYFLVVLTLSYMGVVSIFSMFIVIIFIYIVFVLFAIFFLRMRDIFFSAIKQYSYSEILKRYWNFCKPFIFFSVITFIYNFIDVWMLQKFGGSDQQAFYQIASQFSILSLVTTTAILRVFWKESAAAFAVNNIDRINYIYHNMCKILTVCSAMVLGFILPWSKEITLIFLGKAYSSTWFVLAIMFVYPIHQAIGQINATVCFSLSKTSLYSKVSIVFMFISIPISIVIQAPTSGYVLPGLGMGAVGMALKTVILNIIAVNLLSWFLAKQNNWRFQYLYQIVIVVPLIIFGYMAKYLVVHIFTINVLGVQSLLIFGSISFFIFFVLSLLYAFLVPNYFCLNLIRYNTFRDLRN